MPANQAQFDIMVNSLRSMGHIVERTRGNLADALHGGQRDAHSVETFTYDNVPTNESPDQNASSATFVGSSPTSGVFHQTAGLPRGGEAAPDADYDSGTDSDTASSCGMEEVDFTDLGHLNNEELAHELFWTIEHAKRRWRGLMKKPVCKVRRFYCRHMR